MAKYLGCAVDDVACMRGKSVDEILDAQNHAVKLNPNTLFINFLPFAPMVDGNVSSVAVVIVTIILSNNTQYI